MKINEIVEEYDVDALDFERFLIRKKLPHKSRFSGIIVDDDVIDEYIRAFREYEETINVDKVKKEEIVYPNEQKKNETVNIEAMKFCPYCGKELMSGAVFCAYCGHSIPVSTTSVSASPVSATPVSATPVSSNNASTTVDNNSHNEQSSVETPQKTSATKKIIIAVVSLVIVISMLVSMFDTNNTVIGTWSGNINSSFGIPYTMELTINKGGTFSMILALSKKGESYDGEITDRSSGEWWVEGSKLYIRQYGQSSIEPMVFTVGLGSLQMGTGKNAVILNKTR